MQSAKLSFFIEHLSISPMLYGGKSVNQYWLPYEGRLLICRLNFRLVRVKDIHTFSVRGRCERGYAKRVCYCAKEKLESSV